MVTTGCSAVGSAPALGAKGRYPIPSSKKARKREKNGGKTSICRLTYPRKSGLTTILTSSVRTTIS